MISLTDLTMRYGDQILFANVNLQFNPGARYGLVGANGAGKSTLLRMLMREGEPTEGNINLPARMLLGHLKQDQYKFEDDRILDVVMMGREQLWSALSEKEEILEVTEFTEAHGVRLAELEEIIGICDGYAAEGQAATIIEGLGIPTELHERPLSILSGGFKLRVLLGRLLFSNPDVLLLDEPTNHLDIVSIRWLENYLIESGVTTIVASHDQAFLNTVCTHIVDLDYATIRLYAGNYERFCELKVLDVDQKEAAIKKQERRKDELERFVTRFKAKASKARQAQSKAKQIERLEETMTALPPSSRRHPRFKFDIIRPSGVTPLKVRGIDKSYGTNQVLSGVGFELERGDRCALIGPNGIGKSTLLKILVGATEADAGTYEWGYETHQGYFPQDHKEQVHGTFNVEEWLWQFDAGATIGAVRGLLGRALFVGTDVEKKVSVLSGGESGRLILSRLMLDPHNVLILDEPTNHLDLEAIDQLAEALKTYQGTILFVSHHRHFVGKVATRILEITHEGLRDYGGTYAEYCEKFGTDYLDRDVSLKVAREAAPAAPAQPAAPKPSPKKKSRIGKQEREQKREVTRIEREVEEIEAKKAELDERMLDQVAFEALTEAERLALWKESGDLESRLDELMAAWEVATKALEE